MRNGEDGGKQHDNLISLSAEQKNTLEFYKNQKSVWKSYVHLRLLQATSKVSADSPYVSLKFEATNFLPVGVRFTRVTKSEGTISAGVNGTCVLPPLPETIDEKVGRCDQKEFEIKLPVNGTKVPEFLQSNQSSKSVHQWFIKGEWSVDVYGKTQVWQTKSYELFCQQTTY
jgi:hypothetical protein